MKTTMAEATTETNTMIEICCLDDESINMGMRL